MVTCAVLVITCLLFGPALATNDAGKFLRHLPNFDHIRPTNNSCVVVGSTSQIFIDDIHNIMQSSAFPRWDTIPGIIRLNSNSTTFIKNIYTNRTDFTNAAGLSRYTTNITILEIHCFRKPEWQIFFQHFPMKSFPSVQFLRLFGETNNIGETFFKDNSKLFYLEMMLKGKSIIHPDALTAIGQLSFLKLTYESSDNTVSNIICPLHAKLEYLSISITTSSKVLCEDNFDILEYAAIHDNTIETLNEETFTMIRNVKKLLLYDTSLKYISPNAFLHHKRLTALLIHNGNLQGIRLSEILNPLSNLQYLSLQNDRITEIDSFTQRLISIDLLTNNITQIYNETFSNCVHLKALNLAHNQIKTIKEDAFQSLFSLTNLDLSFNNISTLEKGCFKSLFMIENLTLAGNTLSNITYDIFDRRTINTSNSVYDTSNKQTTFGKLTHLDLSRNFIQNIEENSFKFTILGDLDLHDNKLSHLPVRVFRKMPRLEVLQLSHNDIQFLPPDIFHNVPLHILMLDYNNLTTLHCDLLITSQSTLLSLDLGNNHLINDALCFLSQHVCYKEKPTFFTNLGALLLNNNQLTYVDASMLNNLTQLQFITLNNNPLHCNCDLVPLAVWTRFNIEWFSLYKPLPQCTTDSGLSLPLVNLTETQFCPVQENNTIVIHKIIRLQVYNHPVVISLCVLIIITTLVGIMCRCFRMEIAAIFYAKTGFRLRRHNPEFADKRYNVMVWCHDLDTKFASDTIQVLEQWFTVYWNQRDCIPGEPTMKGFVGGMRSSERVIVILTRNFVTDRYYQLNFENLHVSVGRKDFSALLIVADDEVITHKHRLYERVRGYIRTRQYLRCNDRLFWKKLFYKLPQRPRNAEPVIYADLIQPQIDFNGQRSLAEMLDELENNNVEMGELNADDDANPNNVFVERLGQDIDGFENDQLLERN